MQWSPFQSNCFNWVPTFHRHGNMNQPQHMLTRKQDIFFKQHLISTTPHFHILQSSIFKFRYQSLINNSINSRVVFVMPQNLIMESDHTEGSPCCFCFSSTKKSVVARNGKSSGVLSSEDVEWGKNDEILSDRSTFSVKEQEKRLKKALEEEERVSKEAERVVQWVKQESARIDVSAIKSILSGNQKEPNLM